MIDDRNDVRAVICKALQVNRFDVVEAASAAAGPKPSRMAASTSLIVDVLLVDAIGYDVIASLRDRVPDLPIVAVSELMSLDFDVPNARRAGAGVLDRVGRLK